jgi:hypothetical protein
MPPRFIADGMLGSLTRKLRLYGFDVLYFPNLADPQLLEKSGAQGRLLLTSDRELHRRALKKGVGCVLVSGRGDVERVAQVFREVGSKPALDVSSARCPLCNGEVSAADKEGVASLVPANVLARQKKFYRCVSCQHVYWEGSHWFRLSRFDEQVMEALKG